MAFSSQDVELQDHLNVKRAQFHQPLIPWVFRKPLLPSCFYQVAKDVYGALALSVSYCVRDGNFSKHQKDLERINIYIFLLPTIPGASLDVTYPSSLTTFPPPAPGCSHSNPLGKLSTLSSPRARAWQPGRLWPGAEEMEPKLYLLHLFLQLPPVQKIEPSQDWTSAWPSSQHWWKQIWGTGKRTERWWVLHI